MVIAVRENKILQYQLVGSITFLALGPKKNLLKNLQKFCSSNKKYPTFIMQQNMTKLCQTYQLETLQVRKKILHTGDTESLDLCDQY